MTMSVPRNSTDERRDERRLQESLISLRQAIRFLTIVILVALLAQLVQLALAALPWVKALGSEEAPQTEAASTPAGTSRPLTVTRESGGSIVTKLGYGIVVNKDSTLEREWITVHDAALPADLTGTTGITTVYKRGESYSSGEYNYSASYKLDVKEPLAAVEVRFLTFDIWGEHVRTLTATEVADIAPGSKDFVGAWSVYSENEVSEHYASIAYVARVRTKSGQVHEADNAAVVAEAQKLSSKFSAADLEAPEPAPKP